MLWPMSETTPATDPSLTTDTKPGWKTSGFWLGLAATVAAALAGSGAVDTGTPASGVALVISALGAAGFTAWRLFKKSEDPKKPAWKTSEFWLSCAAVAVSALFAAGVFADGSTGAQIVGFVAMALSALGYTVKPSAKK